MDLSNRELDRLLRKATFEEKYDEVIRLLEKGADPNSVDALHQSPLHYAAKHNLSGNIIYALADHGADFNLKDDNGNTPLDVALDHNQSKNIIDQLKKPARKHKTSQRKQESKKVVDKKQSPLQKQLLSFSEKHTNIDLSKIKRLIEQNKFSEAKDLFDEMKKQYDQFELYTSDLNEVKEKIKSITAKVANGDLDSEAFNKAHNELSKEQRNIEEKMWKIRNKLFKDEYEKPF